MLKILGCPCLAFIERLIGCFILRGGFTEAFENKQSVKKILNLEPSKYFALTIKFKSQKFRLREKK